jgi:Rha family phage regulatory protein
MNKSTSEPMLTDLVVLNDNNVPTTTSLKVAEHFGKDHADVMKRIRTYIKGGVGGFTESSFVNSQNRSFDMYEMDRNAWMILVMGFEGEKALQFKQDFIDAFDRMEATIRDQAGEIQRLTAICERLECAVKQLEVGHDAPPPKSPGVTFPASFRKALPSLGIRPSKFFEYLVETGYISPRIHDVGYEIMKGKGDLFMPRYGYMDITENGYETVRSWLQNGLIPCEYLNEGGHNV